MVLGIRVLIFVLLVFSVTVRGDELTLFAYPSPKAPNWNSPRSIFLTALENELFSLGSRHAHSIGHVNIELKCSATAHTSAFADYAGMTSGTGYNPVSLLLQGYGMGVLFQNFNGKLETPDGVQRGIAHGAKSGHMSYVKFIVSPAACQRLHTYLSEFKERGLDKNYGLPNRPRYGEGAGCSAFAVSFLELAGLLRADLVDAWSKNLEISKTLVGGPLTHQKVSLRRILFSRSGWNPNHTEHMDLFFWEPNLIHQWVQNAWKKKNAPVDFKVDRLGKAHGLVTDASEIPVPTEPIWKY